MAYCSFAGKRLPTAYHWASAATTTVAASIIRLSNFGGEGPAPVGSFAGMSGFGTFDMAGNAKEWVWNETASENSRYILGGGWDDPSYAFALPDARSPFDRSPENGFRCIKYDESLAASELLRPIERPARDFGEEYLVSDETFERFKDQYSYDRTELNVVIEPMADDSEHWTYERITIDSTYGERFALRLFLPTNVEPPYQSVVFWPGSNAVDAQAAVGFELVLFEHLVGGRFAWELRVAAAVVEDVVRFVALSV